MTIWQSLKLFFFIESSMWCVCARCQYKISIQWKRKRSHKCLYYSNCHIDDKISTESAEQTGNESKAMHVSNIVLRYVFMFFFALYLDYCMKCACLIQQNENNFHLFASNFVIIIMCVLFCSLWLSYSTISFGYYCAFFFLLFMNGIDIKRVQYFITLSDSPVTMIALVLVNFLSSHIAKVFFKRANFLSSILLTPLTMIKKI